MSAVVIDASAGAEIVADTRRGRALARLLPTDAEGWFPEHSFAEVLAWAAREVKPTAAAHALPAGSRIHGIRGGGEQVG